MTVAVLKQSPAWHHPAAMGAGWGASSYSSSMKKALIGADASSIRPSNLVADHGTLKSLPSLPQRLLATKNAFKSEARAFIMHFDPAWHTRLSRQLDGLLDVEEWDPSDEVITGESFETFLRVLIKLRGKRHPGIGVGASGHILAYWAAQGESRLTIECMNQDRIRWVISRRCAEGLETAAGTTTLSRLLDVIAPYSPAGWFENDSEKSSR